MSPRNIAIVGAGICGLAHAWSAAERGCSVTVFDRSRHAVGASIRNFGMVWPIGQPAGDCHALALRSRARWLRLSSDADFWVNPCGSLHLAHRDDEWAVLQEFDQQAAGLGYSTELLSPAQVAARTPAAKARGLRGGLFSPTELCVNPRRVVQALPAWLSRQFGVKFEFGTPVTAVDQCVVTTHRGHTGQFDTVVVCSGADLESLFPEILASSGLRLCKLQMLKVKSTGSWRIGPHLASGLTLRHYRNFEVCPSLGSLRRRISEEQPELDQLGIHVMASQNDAGEIILGDSHEYDAAIEPFDKVRIDDLILRELEQVVELPHWNVIERWHGIYAKHPDSPAFLAEPQPGVHVCTGLGGAGMTMSFGIAEQLWDEWIRR